MQTWVGQAASQQLEGRQPLCHMLATLHLGISNLVTLVGLSFSRKSRLVTIRQLSFHGMLERVFGGWMSFLPSLQGQLRAGKDTAFIIILINTDILKILILILLRYVHRFCV